jgi:hypothetical protein
MTNALVGTPDWQNGVISGQSLIGTVPDLSSGGNYNLPPNCESIILACSAFTAGTVVTVIGRTSLINYPVNPIATFNGALNFLAYVPVDSSIDSQITVDLSKPAISPVYIVSDQGIRNVVDLVLAQSIGTPGAAAPGTALQVAGSDGTDLRTFATDPNGRLVPLMATKGVKVGATGTVLAAPSSGHWALFGWSIGANSTAPCEVDLEATDVGVIDVFLINTVASYVDYSSPPLGPVYTADAVTLNVAAGSGITVEYCVLRYAAVP